MTSKAASDFVGRLATDATLREELDAVLAGEPGRTRRLSRMVEFAAQHGYVVTAEALSEFALIPDDTDHLSGDQLSQVAGGMGISAVPAGRLTSAPFSGAAPSSRPAKVTLPGR